jgi:tripartite ATP-independent transporter DctP family solute receptor
MKIKRRLLLLLLVALVAILSLGGCAKDSSGDNSVGKSQDGDVVKLSTFCASITENTPSGSAFKDMAKYVKEKSNGTLELELFFDTALGDATSLVDGLIQGTIDIGMTGTAYFSSIVPEIEVYQLPFLFSDLESARAAVDGESSKMIFDKFEDKGIIGLGFWENGFRELTNNVRPIKTPEDMQGIKMRTLPATIQVKFWEATGAVASAIDAAELYTALQQGIVEAEENPLHEIVSRRFYEVQDYVSITDHVYTPFFMAMSKISWDKLSEEHQKILIEAVNHGKEKQREYNKIATEEAIQVLLDAGIEIEENPDKAAFQEISKTIWPIFTDKYGTELLDIILEGK